MERRTERAGNEQAAHRLHHRRKNALQQLTADLLHLIFRQHIRLRRVAGKLAVSDVPEGNRVEPAGSRVVVDGHGAGHTLTLNAVAAPMVLNVIDPLCRSARRKIVAAAPAAILL